MPFGYVADDDDNTHLATGLVTDRRRVAFDEPFFAVAPDEDCRAAEVLGRASGDDAGKCMLAAFAGALVEKVQDFAEILSHRGLLVPASESFGDGIEHEHATLVVQGDAPVSDRTQRHREALLFRSERSLVAFALDLGGGARGEDLKGALDNLDLANGPAIKHTHDSDGLAIVIDERHADEGVGLVVREQGVFRKHVADALRVCPESADNDTAAGAIGQVETDRGA